MSCRSLGIILSGVLFLCAVSCHRCSDGGGARTFQAVSEENEAPAIRGATLEIEDRARGISGRQVTFISDDGERWAVSSINELNIYEGPTLRSTVAVPLQPSDHQLLLRSDGRALLVGTTEVLLSEEEVSDIPDMSLPRLCIELHREAAVSSRDGRHVAMLLREGPNTCGGPLEPRVERESPLEELFIVERASGDVIARQPVPSSARLALAASSVAFSVGSRVEIASVEDLELRARIPIVGGQVSAMAFSPDESVLVIVRSDGNVVLVDTEQWTVVERWNARIFGPIAIALHPNLPLLAVAGREQLRLWDLTHQPPRELVAVSMEEMGTIAPTGVSFSGDGNHVAIANGPSVDVIRFSLRLDVDGQQLSRPYSIVSRRLRRDRRGRPLPPGVIGRLGEPGVGEGHGIYALLFIDGVLHTADPMGKAQPWPLRAPPVPGHALYEHIDIAPDGSFVVRAEEESDRIEVVEPQTGELLRTITLEQQVRVLRAGPDLVAVGTFGAACVYRSSGEEVRRHPHSTTVTALALSVDGNRFSSSDIDGVTFTSVLTDDAEPSRIVDDAYARSSWMSASGEELALAHSISTVRIWNVVTGDPVEDVETGIDAINHVALSADGRWLVAAGQEMVIYDRRERDLERLRPVIGQDVLAFDDQGRLATASHHGGVHLWDLGTGRPLPSSTGHTAMVEEVRFSSDGAAVISSDQQGNLVRWDLDSGTPTFLGYGSGIKGLGPEQVEPSLLVVTSNYQVEVFDADSGGELWRDDRASSAVALSPRGDRLAVLRAEGRVDFMNARVGGIVETIPGPPGDLPVVLRYRDDATLVGWGTNRLYFWRRDQGWTSAPLPTPLEGHVQLSDEGRYGVLLTGQCAHRVDIDSRELSGCFQNNSGWGIPVSISPDGQTLAIVNGRSVSIWDVDSSTLLAGSEVEGQRITALDYSPDSRLLALGLDDRTIAVVQIPALKLSP